MKGAKGLFMGVQNGFNNCKKRTTKRMRRVAKTMKTIIGGVAPTPCKGVTNNGSPCKKTCQGDYCKIHEKMFKRDNPVDRLVPTDTENARAIIKIFNKMKSREGKPLLERAMQEILACRKMFPPALNVNKFVTGGVSEDAITELISGLGFPTDNVASTKTVIDIEVQVDATRIGISLKNSGDINQSPILENYRGESKAEIRPLPPTLIIYTEVVRQRTRIVYLDHDIIRKAFPPETDLATLNRQVYNKKAVAEGEKDTQSNLSFKSGFLAAFIPKLPEEYKVSVDFPKSIPDVPIVSITQLALAQVKKAMAESRQVVSVPTDPGN
jgi:hypothetical protein